MKLSILKLILDQFKGISHYEFTPDGRNADIFGGNGTGKTTIADAYFWLLFGKDSAGRSDSNFNVKTNGTSGLDYSVKGEFLGDDGQPFTLQRVFKEKFRRKNGEAEQKPQGNETDFYINGVPKPKKDYTTFIAAICDEKTFYLLTDPDMFPGKMKMAERRDMLIRLFAPDVDDQEIINTHEKLKPLMHYIGLKSVDEYAEQTKYERQKINKQLADIPGRIDEAQKAKPADLPGLGDGPAMLRIQKQKMKLENDIAAIRNGEAAKALRNQVLEVKAKISQATAEYSRASSVGNSDLAAEMTKVRAQISKLQGEVSSGQLAVHSAEKLASGMEAELDELRQKCIDTANQEFDESNTICPTCGQEYPPERLEEIRAEFNGQKAAQLERLESKGKELAVTKKDVKRSLQDHLDQLAAAERSLAAAQDRLKKLSAQYVQPAPFESTDRYRQLRQEQDQLENQLAKLESAGNQRIAELQEQAKAVTEELETIKHRALNKVIIAQQDKRIAELKRQETELAQLLATYDEGLRLAELFTQTKALDIEEKVDSAFRLVRWKLFDVQENGGIKSYCEATVKGIEYNTNLNSAAKLNAGLDIINTLGRAAGVSVPVWIDNAESVTSMLPIAAQVIRLHVSGRDKQLRAEVRK